MVEGLPLCPETGGAVLSIAHYFSQEGDLCADPEMELRVIAPTDDNPGTVEALSFGQAIPPIYQRVYAKPGFVAPRLKRELNEFLSMWLRNLKEQGHRLVGEGG